MNVLSLNVERDDNAGLKGWLQQHEANYKDRAWFAEVKQAIERGDWDRAWAYAGVVRYNAAYVDATTAEQMAAALGRPSSASAAAADRSVQSPVPAASTQTSWTVKRMKHFVIGVICVVLGTGFVLLVWPTPYRYNHLALSGENGAGPVFPVRINRWSGAPEILVPPAYAAERRITALAWVAGASQALPSSAVTQLRAGASVAVANGELSGDIFNGTDWTIAKIRWDVTSRQSGSVLTRQFDEDVSLAPNTQAALSLSLGRYGENASAELIGAWGAPPPSGTPVER